MKIATFSEVISPEVGTLLAGYGRNDVSIGKHDDLRFTGICIVAAARRRERVSPRCFLGSLCGKNAWRFLTFFGIYGILYGIMRSWRIRYMSHNRYYVAFPVLVLHLFSPVFC